MYHTRISLSMHSELYPIFKIKADDPIVTKPNMCEGWLDNISYSPNKFGFEALDL